MNAFGNKKNNMLAFMMAFVLVSAAFLGLAMIPGVMAAQGDFDDPYPDDTLLEGVGIGSDWAYNTSTSQVIPINYTLRDKSITLYPEQVLVYTMVDMVEVELYKWVPLDGALADPFNWTMNLTIPNDYIITVEVIFYEQIDGDYRMDSMELEFAVLDGINFITDVETDKASVLNDGSDSIVISFTVGRDEADIGDIQMNLYNEWLILAGGDGFVFENNLTMGDLTATPGTGSTDYSYTWTPAMGHLAGYISTPYDVVIEVTDDWDYSEDVYSDDLFELVWMEMPPYMYDGEIEFEEDSFAVVDLDDHFEDINGAELNYYINFSALENLMISWVNETEHTINITAMEDWNGVEEVPVMFNDSVNPDETDNMTITVNPVEDDLMVSMDHIMVDEMEMMATFDALMLFYDPDGPVENLTVSLGYDEETNETTNVTTMTPIYMYEDDNITVTINETDFANSMAEVNVDVEEGMWGFPVTAWIDGNVSLEDQMAYVELVPVNDVPMLTMDTVMVYKNEMKSINLTDYFDDPDGPEFNLTVNTTVTGADLMYDWETFMLDIDPDVNWTGTIEVEINATDSVEYMVYTLTIEVILRSYTVTGMVTFEEVTDVMVNMSNVTLSIGGDMVELDENNSFSITLDEGEYAVVLTIPAMYLYDAAMEMSGYVMPELENISLMADTTYDIDVEYMVYVNPIPTATWDDIDWDSKTIDDEDGTITITVGVDNDTYMGYGDLTIQLVIKDGDDEYNFTMEWNDTQKKYVLELTEDDLEDIPEGERTYHFTDGTSDSPEYDYEFKEKDENANLITVIVLIVLIILVLIALVFIMRKPSEEEFDEEEEEEEEEGERSCPSCGETITDEEAEECPYCGEDLEE